MKLVLFNVASFDTDTDTTELWSKVYSHHAVGPSDWQNVTTRDVHKTLLWVAPETAVRCETLKAAQRWAELVDAFRNPF